jgi:peptide/nickel transport system ATP-binding protein
VTALLRLDELSVRYAGAAEAALGPVSLELAPGERLAVIGESGSGKSTLALALTALLPPDARVSGAVCWPGFDQPPRPGRDVGLVFQDPGASLDPVMRVGEQVAEVARAHLGLGRRAARARAVELIGRVGLPEPAAAARAWPHQLSGGQRQRVALAAAVVAGPRLLVADEMTSALDTLSQARIVALVDGLVRDTGMALVFITHDLALAARVADRVLVLRGGRLVEAGPAGRLLAAPAEPYTAELIAAHIDLDTPPLVGTAA